MDSMTKQRREGEANSPRGQRPARVSRRGPSWTEFVRLAHQAVVAIAGAGMINRAEPRACGSSREPIGQDIEPGPKGTQARCQTQPETAAEGHRATRLGLQPYRGKPAVRNETRGWGKRRHDLMAICHDARKGRYIGSHWSKPGAPPLHSTGANSLCRRVYYIHVGPTGPRRRPQASGNRIGPESDRLSSGENEPASLRTRKSIRQPAAGSVISLGAE